MNMRHYVLSLFLLGPILIATAQESKLWQEYAKDHEAGKQTELPDFSYAGYHFGEVAIPEVDHKIFDVTDFGAKPNDQKSDRAAIEKAVAAAKKNGSGVVFFPKGRFLVNEDNDPKTSIVISAKNIVLRGSGSGEGGTELYMKNYLPAKNPKQLWTCPYMFKVEGRGAENEVTTIVADAKRGDRTIQVKSAAAIRPGKWIIVRVKNNAQDLIEHDMCGCQLDEKWTKIKDQGIYVNEPHLVEKVKGKTVTLKAPLLHDVDKKHNWKVLTYAHYEEVGVEDIAFVGNWHDDFVHHQDYIHDGGYSMLQMHRIANGWVRNCRFTDANRACTISLGANVSVLNCEVTGNTGHNSISASASARTLIGCCNDAASTWHAPGVSSASIGTVLWRVNYTEHTSFETHASQPRATLFDVTKGGFFLGRGGGARQNLPNHMEHLILWNFEELDEGEENFEFWSSKTWFWKIIPPYVVGFHGAGTTFDESQIKVIESLHNPVLPASLYEAQLSLRLGELPQWVEDAKAKMIN